MIDPVRGKAALQALADRYPQLYVAPSDKSLEAYQRAARQGKKPDNADLDHFHSTDEDELMVVETPAGPIVVLCLNDRSDFETFLQIIGHKARPDRIAPEVGAITYRGLVDWVKVATALKNYLDAGGTDPRAELARLAAEPGAIRTELVVISAGPYSNVPASETEYDEAEWLRLSRDIRLYHECSHVVCRRVMPEDILPLWDEVTADAVGLLCATGSYDAELAARFLGAGAEGYRGGRLPEYLTDEQVGHIDDIAREIYVAQQRIEELAQSANSKDPFDLLLDMKREPYLGY